MTSRPFIPVVGGLKVEMRYDLFGQNCENVFYVDRGETAIETAMTALGPLLVSWWTSNMRSHTSHNVGLQSVKITDMSAADGPTLLYTTGLPLGGSNITASMPGNVALATKLNSTYRGRNSTGRQFFIGVPSDAVDGDVVTTVFQLAVKAGYEALLTALTGGGFSMVVVSFIIDKILRTAGLKSPVATITVDNALDSQRRRLIGRGR